MNQLGNNHVHIWYSYCDDVLATRAREPLLTMLSADERQRYHRFVFDKSRRQFLMGRVLVRSVLSQYVPIAPEQWEFAYTGRGKPYIAPRFDLSQVHFNHSHTDQLVACAVAMGSEVGVDVECLDREIGDRVAEYCLSPKELDCYVTAGASERHDLFFRQWTLKEAFAKARGLGLSLAFTKVSFSLGNGVPVLSPESPSGDDPGDWQFYQCLVTPRHYLAVAVHRRSEPRSRFVVRQWPPNPSQGK